MSARRVNPARLDSFVAVYAPTLARVARENPAEYPWVADTPTEIVVERMRDAFLRGSYNHTGAAIRATCRALGLKHTRTAIEEFLTGEGAQ